MAAIENAKLSKLNALVHLRRGNFNGIYLESFLEEFQTTAACTGRE